MIRMGVNTKKRMAERLLHPQRIQFSQRESCLSR